MIVLSEKQQAAIDSAFNDRDKLAAGWQPPGELWADAPVLNRWFHGVHPVSGTMAIVGERDGEQRRSSPVVAMLTGPGGIGWARTLNGWIRLALTVDELHAPGLRTISEGAREIEFAAQRAGYTAPNRTLQPTGPLALDDRWAGVADHFDRTAEDSETALAVFYARLRKVGLTEARMMVAGWWVARQLDFEIA
ncbi:hypothetical protein [Methylobacterium sp. J-092]|uniref:hypothetical protein n=1 Tax=Methylobacterium sp. J-092 TaxID=2836667 RepID=UPI001FBB3B10|nr:hypothetical protein [Methylobacterium sp. J-092]MCJ2007028.1 hypothetical protein [Methylobacterium sp. J-092]